MYNVQIEHCLGVEQGVLCFCSNSLPNSSLPLDKSECVHVNMTCPGDNESSCGGHLAMDVYETGLLPVVPPKSGVVETGTNRTSVKVVYLLTLSGRAIRQVHRLIKQIYSPDHYILVHVDSRQEFMHRQLEKLSTVLPNMKMMKRRYTATWGGVGLLRMLLSAIREVNEIEEWSDWEFILNLSESDFPIKSQFEFVTFLSNNRGKNFVQGIGEGNSELFVQKQGLSHTFYECDFHIWNVASRTLPSGIQFDGSSDWIILNKEFADYLVYSEDEILGGLKKIFNFSLLPAESFFHTVLRNSRFCGTHIDNNLRFVNWNRSLGCRCNSRDVDWCTCSPNTFVANDWSKIDTITEQSFFARKFEPIIHQGIINKLEDKLNNVTSLNESSRFSYWQNEYHVLDTKTYKDLSSLYILIEEEVLFLNDVMQEAFSLKEIVTVTTYSYNDEFQGFLIQFCVASSNGEIFYFESKIRLKVLLKFVPHSITRVKSISVGANYDSKERVFRNFLGILNDKSRIGLKIEYEEGDPERVEFRWFNPDLKLQSINKLQLNETGGIALVTPEVSSGFEPGVWTVMCLIDGRTTSKLEFLVTPASDNKSKTAKKIQEWNIRARVSYQFTKQFFEVLDRCAVNDETLAVQKCGTTP